MQLDRAVPDYDGSVPRRVVRILPIGTRLRIERLMFDNGEGSQLWVTASLDDGTYPKKIVYVNWGLLAENRWIGGPHPGVPHPPGSETSRTWTVNPKYLESASPPRKAKGGEK